MQRTLKKSNVSKSKNTEKTLKEELPSSSKKEQEEKLKKNNYNTSTPRNFVQKSSPADIYSQRKKSTVVDILKAPKKVTGVSKTRNNETPTKDLVKRTPSSMSLKGKSSNSTIPTTPKSTTKINKANFKSPKVPFTNITVYSPPTKRKLNMDSQEEIKKSSDKVKTSSTILSGTQKRSKDIAKRLESGDSSKAHSFSRHRSKTRTLEEDEIKVLTPEAVDNNAELLNMRRKLTAKPIGYFVSLDSEKTNAQNDKSCEDEVSYEDDFESYESDFDSYHSEESNSGPNSNHDDDDELIKVDQTTVEVTNEQIVVHDSITKDTQNGEKMLDSGNFELTDHRLADKPRIIMDFIKEGFVDGIDEKKLSIISDEGFQEISSHSGVSSIKNVEVFDKPIFINFNKFREIRRKRKTYERLKQRTNSILSMVTLQESSYTLFEMKPIPYDLYIATFGRSNYTQSAVQTFEDGETQEVQTEEILYEQKWTQHPTEFSQTDVYLNVESKRMEHSKSIDDVLYNILNSDTPTIENVSNEVVTDESYLTNPLRMYLEQKHGAGEAKMLPYEIYKSKLRNSEFSVERLRKFLRSKVKKVSRILSINAGNNMLASVNNSKLPFSKGFVSISNKATTNDSKSSIKYVKIRNLVFSQTSSNFVITVHDKTLVGSTAGKCIATLWDVSVARSEPIKFLVAVDSVTRAQFLGNVDGIFVAALEDGSIHLWDLSEEPTWRTEDNTISSNLIEDNYGGLTETERDREWNLKNKDAGFEPVGPESLLQSSAYTSTAINMQSKDVVDSIVGLEILWDTNLRNEYQSSDNKIYGQVYSLMRIGILSIWNVVKEKTNTATTDLGKAFWSKLKLEISQKICLADHLNVAFKDSIDDMSSFDLNTVKLRLLSRKQEKTLSKEFSCKATRSFDNKNTRLASVATSNVKMSANIDKNIVSCNWEDGIVCNDLKITIVNKTNNFLVAKNCGEVIVCTKSGSNIQVKKICVATDISSISFIEPSPHGLPYFFAATDSGTIHLCSLFESRVLLTLNCRNDLRHVDASDKCISDSKGRFISSVTRSPINSPSTKRESLTVDWQSQHSISHVAWSRVNPCNIFALSLDGNLSSWELTHSDIYAQFVCEKAALCCRAGETTLGLLTPEGEVQVYLLSNEQHVDYLDIFKKYILLL